MLFVSHSALLFVSHPHIRTSAKLVLSHTASLFVSQIPSPTRPKVNLDEHCSLGVTPSRVYRGELTARGTPDPCLLFAVLLSTIDALCLVPVLASCAY